MPVLTLLLTALYLTGDTLTIDVDTALQRAVEWSPMMTASRLRTDAAVARTKQATAWLNPQLAASAENVGQQRTFTGVPGINGLEGQVVMALPLPLGYGRAGARATAQANEEAAHAWLSLAERDVRKTVLVGIGHVWRDEALVDHTAQELRTLTSFAEALQRQADAGRASRGDAARANLARSAAVTKLARREAVLAMSQNELARLLGFQPNETFRVARPTCEGAADGAAHQPDMSAPEFRVAQSRVDAATGSIRWAQSQQLPKFEPQVGVRRTGGQTGLYIGFAATLPLLDRGTNRVAAAKSEEDAARAEQREQETRWLADHHSALKGLRALERAGEAFTSDWFQDVEQTVTAAEARFQLGEGSLFELLDNRRARLQALDDYATWQAEWWEARAELSRLEGQPLTSSILCTNPYGGVR